jgi:hypothetical protein
MASACPAATALVVMVRAGTSNADTRKQQESLLTKTNRVTLNAPVTAGRVMPL